MKLTYLKHTQNYNNMFKGIINVLIALSLVILSSTALNAQSHRTCATTDYTNNQIAKNPALRNILEQQELAIKNWTKNASKDNSVITIPVIFHVIYNSDPNTNISDAQILSQITILNDDYARLNSDTFKTPDMFKGVAANSGIQFCIAHQDPNGDWTNGITRTQTTKTQFDVDVNDAKYDSQGGKDSWNTSLYLNVWIVPELVSQGFTGILGYAQLPGGAAATDGVVVGYNYIGNIGAAQHPFNKGRTLTHEAGHYFNLRHIWGDDGNGCSGSDYVQDTPNQASENYGCPTHPSKTCSNDGDMFQNFMDYTNDACMNLFTEGQVTRMRAAINTSRASLITSGMCKANTLDSRKDKVEFNIYPNPANKKIHIQSSDRTDNIEIKIIDITGKTVFVNNYKNMEATIIINTSELSDGIYFIKISNTETTKVQKLIIQQ